MVQTPRITPRARSRSSFPLQPAGRPISRPGSSPTFSTVISAKNSWWRMSAAPGAPTGRFARAAPDGYTLLSGHLGTNALAPAFYPDLAYDPQKDFEPIGLTAEYPELLVVRKDFPADNLKEFVAYAKANASKLNVGHAGLGSVSYIGCLLLNSAIH